jgi:hypothetical protein
MKTRIDTLAIGDLVPLQRWDTTGKGKIKTEGRIITIYPEGNPQAPPDDRRHCRSHYVVSTLENTTHHIFLSRYR